MKHIFIFVVVLVTFAFAAFAQNSYEISWSASFTCKDGKCGFETGLTTTYAQCASDACRKVEAEVKASLEFNKNTNISVTTSVKATKQKKSQRCEHHDRNKNEMIDPTMVSTGSTWYWICTYCWGGGTCQHGYKSRQDAQKGADEHRKRTRNVHKPSVHYGSCPICNN